MTQKVADRKSQSKERMDGAQKEKKDNIEQREMEIEKGARDYREQ